MLLDEYTIYWYRRPEENRKKKIRTILGPNVTEEGKIEKNIKRNEKRKYWQNYRDTKPTLVEIYNEKEGNRQIFIPNGYNLGTSKSWWNEIKDP